MALPHVIAHVATSVDGFTTGFEIDVPRYYELITTWDEDVTLAGADTILAQEPNLAGMDLPGPNPDGPLLAVVDSGRRVTAWDALRDCGHWRDAVALRGGQGAAESSDGEVQELVAGSGDRVDLEAALTALAERHDARVVRVDSGGTLIGALLRAGLLGELSLLVHPAVAGEAGAGRWHGADAPPATGLETIAAEPLDGGLVWARYRVTQRAVT